MSAKVDWGVLATSVLVGVGSWLVLNVGIGHTCHNPAFTPAQLPKPKCASFIWDTCPKRADKMHCIKFEHTRAAGENDPTVAIGKSDIETEETESDNESSQSSSNTQSIADQTE